LHCFSKIVKLARIRTTGMITNWGIVREQDMAEGGLQKNCWCHMPYQCAPPPWPIGPLQAGDCTWKACLVSTTQRRLQWDRSKARVCTTQTNWQPN